MQIPKTKTESETRGKRRERWEKRQHCSWEKQADLNTQGDGGQQAGKEIKAGGR